MNGANKVDWQAVVRFIVGMCFLGSVGLCLYLGCVAYWGYFLVIPLLFAFVITFVECCPKCNATGWRHEILGVAEDNGASLTFWVRCKCCAHEYRDDAGVLKH